MKKPPPRRLALPRTTLRALTRADLTTANAGAPVPTETNASAAEGKMNPNCFTADFM
jgi:hypothetical protein